MMEWQTLSIGLGLIVSLSFTELFGLSVGGMIVPGYLALSLHKPLDVMVTLMVALLTFVVVRGISSFAIIYGRRRIALMVLMGFLIGTVVRSIIASPAVSHWPLGGTPDTMATTETMVCVIGHIIPGLIALWIDRQGFVETLAPMMTSAVVVRLVLILMGMEIML